MATQKEIQEAWDEFQATMKELKHEQLKALSMFERRISDVAARKVKCMLTDEEYDNE